VITDVEVDEQLLNNFCNCFKRRYL